MLLTLAAGLAAGAVAWLGFRAAVPAVIPARPKRDARELPAWIVIPLRAAFGVLIAAGLLTGPLDALALWAVLVLGQLAQRRVGRSARWFERVRKLPDAARLLAVLVATTVIGLLVVPPLFGGQRSAVAGPVGNGARPGAHRRGDATAGALRAGGGTKVIRRALTTVALASAAVVLLPGVAVADNCSGLTDCYGSAQFRGRRGRRDGADHRAGGARRTGAPARGAPREQTRLNRPQAADCPR